MDGILNINKPIGITSYKTVEGIKKLTGEKRVGHAGTLDPLACGVLPVCLGRATRIVEYLNEMSKVYLAEVALGKSTDTYDTEGRVTKECDASFITKEQIESALGKFRGEITQKPPMYSAVKYQGKRLYEIARQGITVPRKNRKIAIYRLELKSYQRELATLTVECSRGTYIRSLAYDLGEALGCGAYLKSLIRTSYGLFNIEDSLSPLQVAGIYEEGRLEEIIFPLDEALSHLPAIYVDSESARSLRNGRAISLGESCTGKKAAQEKPYRAYVKDGGFIGLVKAEIGSDYWRPLKVLN